MKTRNYSLSLKFGAVVAGLLLLFAATLAVSWWQFTSQRHQLTDYNRSVDATTAAGRLQGNLLMASDAMQDFVSHGDAEDKATFEERWQKAMSFQKELASLRAESGRGAEGELASLANSYHDNAEQLMAVADGLNGRTYPAAAESGGRAQGHLDRLIEELRALNDQDGLVVATDLRATFLRTLVYINKFYVSASGADSEEVDRQVARLSDLAAALEGMTLTGEAKVARDELLAELDRYQPLVAALQKEVPEREALTEREANELAPKLEVAVENLKLNLVEEQKGLADQMDERAASARWTVLAIGLCALVAGGAAAAVVLRSTSRTLQGVITGLNEVSEQVASASSQVSSASHELAESTSEEAASLEETSSSLEELSSMTTSNAENSVRSRELVEDTQRNMATAKEAVINLAQQMRGSRNPASRRKRLSRRLTRSPSRRTSWPSMRRWRPRGRAKPGRDSPWWPKKSGTWRAAPPSRLGTPPRSSKGRCAAWRRAQCW